MEAASGGEMICVAEVAFERRLRRDRLRHARGIAKYESRVWANDMQGMQVGVLTLSENRC